MADASTNLRSLIWRRAILAIAGMVSGGALIWYLGSQYTPLPLPVIVRSAIFIEVTVPLIFFLSDPNLFTAEHLLRPASVGVAAGLGALFGANFMANSPISFGSGIEPTMDIAMVAGGLAAVCYYAYTVRKYPRGTDLVGIEIALFAGLGVIGFALLLMWLMHIMHPHSSTGGTVRIATQTLLWQSLRLSRKYVKDNSVAIPPAMQVATS